MNKLLVNLIAGSSLLFTILFFLNPNQYNKPGNRWLGLFIFSIFLMNIDEFLYFNNLKVSNFKFYVYSRYCVAPIFYFTILYFVNPTKKWRPIYFLHFAFGFLFMIFEQNSTRIVNGNVVINEGIPYFAKYFNIFLMYIVLPIQIVFYLRLSFIEIVKHEKNIKKISSNTEEVDLKWLKHIVYIIIGFSLFFILYIVNQSAIMINSILLITLLFIGFNAMRQKEIFPYNNKTKKEIQKFFEFDTEQQNQKRKLISEDKFLEIKNKLTHHFETEKLFLDSDLSLVSLSKKFDIPTHVLSYVINEGFGENFNQFVNRYRIEEAKKMIQDPKNDHLSILGIGYEVGFNSKSVFTTTFKKVTNQTPSQYKKANLP